MLLFVYCYLFPFVSCLCHNTFLLLLSLPFVTIGSKILVFPLLSAAVLLFLLLFLLLLFISSALFCSVLLCSAPFFFILTLILLFCRSHSSLITN